MNKIGLLSILLTVLLISGSGALAATINVPGDYATIQAAINAATAGDEILIAAGTYNERPSVNKSLTFVGADEATVIIDAGAATSGSYGFTVSADDVSISDLTLVGDPGSSTPRYGFKPSQVANFTLTNVTAKEFYRTGVDLLGVTNGVLTDIVSQDNGGHGLALVDCNDVTVTNITLSGNGWQNVSVATWGNHSPLGTSGIVFAGTNSFGELFQLEMGDYNNPGVPPAGDAIITYSTNIGDGADVTVQSADFGWAIHGEQDDSPGQVRIWFMDDFANAAALLAAAPIGHWTGNDMYIESLTDGTLLYVTPGGSIQAAVDAASPGDVIDVAAGTYPETVNVNKAITLNGEDAGRAFTYITGGMTIAAGVDGATLSDLYITGVGASNSVVRMLGGVLNLTMDGCVIDGEDAAGRHGFSGGQLEADATINNCGFKNILGWALFESRSGSGGGGSPMETINFTNNDIQDCNGAVVFRGDETNWTDVVYIIGNSWENIGGNGGVVGDAWAAFEVNRAEDVNIYNNFVDDVAENSWGEGQAAQIWSITDLDMQYNVFQNCWEGIWIAAIDGTDVPGGIIAYNTIANYTDWALKIDGTTNGPLDVEMNWWGDAAGPYHATLNPGGVASATVIGDYIDFDPWVGKAGGENIVCDPEPLELTEAVSTASLDVDYLGGGSAGVRTIHIVFTWDTADVDLTGIVQGDLFGAEPSQFFSFIGTGTATVDWSLTGLPEEINPASGPGTIFTPTFAAVATCDSDVDPEIVFTEVVFRDAYNGNISGVYARDGEITVDTEDPVVAGVGYDNSLPHAEAFVKTGDSPTLSATVTDGCVATSILTISGDFSNLLTNAGWDDMAPTSLVGDDASWDFPTDDLAADGTYTVTLTATDLLGNEGTATFDITIDNTAPTAIAAVAAGPGHNEIDLTWADPSGLDANYYAVELWRTAWGAYPEYDDDAAAPSYPVPPTTGTMVAGVPTGTLTSFTETFASDGSERDVYYYTAVVIDKALNKGPAVGSAQDRSTNYWLGDVAPAGPPLGNGRVFSEDISVLSATYFKTSTDGGYDNTCDVGPTDDMSRTGIPDTDNVINFEDLIVFSMNYDVDSPEGRNDSAPGGEAMPVALELKVPSDVSLQPGSRLVVSAVLSDEGAAVKGTRFVVQYDEQALVCRGVHEGALVADCNGFFKAFVQDGSADISAAALGRGLTLGGSGIVAELIFEVRGTAQSDLSLEEVTLRNVANHELMPSSSGVEVPIFSSDVIPTSVFLGANRPNPFAGMTQMDFGLPQDASVKLAVFDVSGRLVRTLINGELTAGEHTAQWDRTTADGTPVAGGMYFYRLETPKQVMTRKMIVSD